MGTPLQGRRQLSTTHKLAMAWHRPLLICGNGVDKIISQRRIGQLKDKDKERSFAGDRQHAHHTNWQINFKLNCRIPAFAAP